MSATPLRVLLITARADVGGGPRHVDLLARHLPATVERWIAAPGDEPYAAQWRALTQEKSAPLRGVFQIPHRRFSLPALMRLANACREHHIQIVHSHGKGAGLYARLLKLLVPSVRVVHTFHGVHLGEYGALSGFAYRLLERALRPLTAACVNVSRGEQRQCLALGFVSEQTSHVIYNGIDTDAVARAESPASANASPGAARPTHTPVILTVARFHYQKHMALALEIADRARVSHPDWCFVWVGDGPELVDIQREATRRGVHNVTFAGATNDVSAYLRTADILLSTSRWEGLPYTLLEACAEGVPIVATNVVGNDEVVVPGVNGWLFAPDDPDEAMPRIAQIVGDETHRAQLADGGRQLAQSTFSLTRSIDALAKLYDGLI